MRFEERSPLEFTKVSIQSKLIVCPHCKTGQNVSKSWYSGQCINCKKYFNIKDSLPEDEMKGFGSSTNRPINKAFTAQKAEMEKKAHEFRETTNQKRSDGTQRSHEPGGRKRNW